MVAPADAPPGTRRDPGLSVALGRRIAGVSLPKSKQPSETHHLGRLEKHRGGFRFETAQESFGNRPPQSSPAKCRSPLSPRTSR
jgi:hypothetical protein